jgi:hypothetical protein
MLYVDAPLPVRLYQHPVAPGCELVSASVALTGFPVGILPLWWCHPLSTPTRRSSPLRLEEIGTPTGSLILRLSNDTPRRESAGKNQDAYESIPVTLHCSIPSITAGNGCVPVTDVSKPPY